MVCATSKFDVGNIHSPVHPSPKTFAVFKNQRAYKVPKYLQGKLNRPSDILELYEIVLPVNKEQQPEGNNFINPVIILARGEALKMVFVARNLNTIIDESKSNWPIEAIQVTPTKINRH